MTTILNEYTLVFMNGDDMTNQTVDSKREMDSLLLERGHKLLIQEFGPAGALDFLRLAGNVQRPESECRGIKDVLVNIGIVKETHEVSIRFNHPITWLRFSATDAMHFAKKIAARAAALAEQQA